MSSKLSRLSNIKSPSSEKTLLLLKRTYKIWEPITKKCLKNVKKPTRKGNTKLYKLRDKRQIWKPKSKEFITTRLLTRKDRLRSPSLRTKSTSWKSNLLRDNRKSTNSKHNNTGKHKIKRLSSSKSHQDKRHSTNYK